MKDKSRRRHLRPSVLKLLYWAVLLSSGLTFVYVCLVKYNDKIIQPKVYLTISSSSELKRREILMSMNGLPDSRSIYENTVNSELKDFDLSLDTPHSQNYYDSQSQQPIQSRLWPDLFWPNKMEKQGNRFLSLHSPPENEGTSPMIFIDPAITTPGPTRLDLHGTTTSRLQSQEKFNKKEVEKSLRERLNRVESYCRPYVKALKNMRLKEMLKRQKTMWIQYQNLIPIDNGFNNIRVQWCPIYKAASSPWMSQFMQLKKVLTAKSEQMIRTGRLTFVKLARVNHLSLFHPQIFKSQQEKEMHSRDFNISMIVVRHPFERILSAYRDKLERLDGRIYYNKKYGLPIIRKFRKTTQWRNSISLPLMTRRMMDYRYKNESFYHRESSGRSTRGRRSRYYYDKYERQRELDNRKKTMVPTFNEFIQFLLSQSPTRMDEHWRPFYVDCNACLGTKFNLILKVETMNRDRDYFLNLIGKSSSTQNSTINDFTELNKVWKRWANSVDNGKKSQQDKRKSQNYFSQISQHDLLKLYDMYEPDFKMFGYSPDDYIKIVM